MRHLAAAIAAVVLLATPAVAHDGCHECSTWPEYRADYLAKNEPQTTNERLLATQAPDLLADAWKAWKEADRKWQAALQEASEPVTAVATTVNVGASAGISADWYAIAECEGFGNWDLVTTGNGYYFVLQFAPSTWLAYGGTQAELDAGVAPSPSRLIQVAENVLAGQGPGAWPNCFQYL